MAKNETTATVTATVETTEENTPKKRKIALDEEKRTVTIFDTVYTVDNLPDEIKNRLILHGLKQKLSDCTAGMKDYTDNEKAKEVAEVYERLTEGKWSKPGEGRESLSKKLDAAWANGTKEEKALLVKMGIYNEKGERIKK